jgi:hypothetical protein
MQRMLIIVIVALLSLEGCATVSRYRALSVQDNESQPIVQTQTFGFWGLVGVNEPPVCSDRPTLVSVETRVSPLSFLFLGLIGWTETRVFCR